MLKHPVIIGVTVIGAALALLAGYPIVNVLVAAVALFAILLVGTMVLGGLARPIPEPPPAGELRKVRLTYRCELCGAEVRMTVSPTDDPEPPRHCMEDMTLQTPVE